MNHNIPVCRFALCFLNRGLSCAFNDASAQCYNVTVHWYNVFISYFTRREIFTYSIKIQVLLFVYLLDNVQGWHGTKMETPWQSYRIKMVNIQWFKNFHVLWNTYYRDSCWVESCVVLMLCAGIYLYIYTYTAVPLKLTLAVQILDLFFYFSAVQL